MTLVEDLKDAAECLLVPVPKDTAGYVYYAEAQLCLKAADRIVAMEGTNRDLGEYAGRLVDKCLKLEAALRWHAQTVHQAHHDGSIEDCPKSTCVAARDAL